MTSLAIIPEAPIMDIVAAMAVTALRTHIGGLAGADMAGQTREPLVPAGQREIGLRIVVETPDAPVGRIVTIAAFGRCPERSLVLSVLVTIGTSRALDSK